MNKLNEWRILDMSKINLLEETIKILANHGLTLEDIQFIKTRNGDFRPKFGGRKFLDVDYDNGYGGNEIDLNLKIVGYDWGLERHEYDGTEWWEFKKLPTFEKKVDCFVTPYDEF